MSRYFSVRDYFTWVEETMGYHLAVKDFAGFLDKDIGNIDTARPYFIHSNPYCMFIKSDPRLWVRCQVESHRFHLRCLKSDIPFTGMCYCGFGELVVPIVAGGKTIGAICAGGFELLPAKSKRRREKIMLEYGFNSEEGQKKYDLSVQPKPHDLRAVLEVCSIIANYFSLYYTLLVEKRLLHTNSRNTGEPSKPYILSHAVEYIRQNYSEDITVSGIAHFCHCSESYISHIFKKGTGINIKKYINQVRIGKAQELIATSSDSFISIAGRCGFSDPNYFTVVFKQTSGKTPSQYRNDCQR